MTMIGRGIGLALASALALAGCSPGADEVTDAVGDLPGVISAEPACHEFLCTVEIEAEPTASAADLADMIAAARTVDDAWDVEVSLLLDRPGRVSARLVFDEAPATEDPAVGTLLAWAAAQQGLSTLTVERSTAEDARVAGAAVGGTSIWPLAREAWPLTEELGGAELHFSQPAGGQQSLWVHGTFPEDVVEVAEEVEAVDGVTGVVITGDRFLVGAINRSLAQRLRTVLTDDARLDAVTTEVVVTTNVLQSATAAEPGTAERLDPVLAALDGQPGVSMVLFEGDTIDVEVYDNFRSAPRLIERVRRRAGAAFVDTTVVLHDLEERRSIEITPDGDDAVLDLALALLATDGLRGLDVSQDDDPDRPEVGLGVSLRQSGPGTGAAPPVGPEVTRLARLLASTPGTAASYWLSVEVEDADGRSADAGWRVDRTPDGFALGEIGGTEERQAEVRAAWARGVA